MAAGPSVGAQLNDMINSFKRYERTTISAGPQCADLSFMTLLWPLLPLLPPEPPTLLTDLLKEQEKCDLCGTSQGTRVQSYTKRPKGSTDTTDSSLRLRRGSDWKTPLDRLMVNVEHNVTEVLNSIQETTEKSTKLSQKVDEIEKSQMSDTTDEELLKTLKKLTKVKADQMEKVKTLEVKEQQLKESLTNAIEWARNVELNMSIPGNKKVTLENLASEKNNLPNEEEGKFKD